MAEPHDRKPILTIEQQIEHLKQKGRSLRAVFRGRGRGLPARQVQLLQARILPQTLLEIRGGPRDGRYVDLDFGQLRLLAALDRELRHALLGHDARHRAFPEGDTASRDGGPWRGRLRHRGRLHGIAYHCKQGVPPARAQDERPQPLQLEPLREVLRRHACPGLPELTSFGTLIDFVRFCAERWGDRRLEASHYDLKRVKSVRNCAAHGSCLINCFAERGAARGSASSGVSRRVAAVGIPKATERKWMGNTAMQEVATVLVAHSGLVPEGSSRSRAASELAEMFAGADGETEALPDKGPTPQLAPRSSSFAG